MPETQTARVKHPCIFDHMREDFRRIEAAAREQVAAELDIAELTPLVYGDPIAWAECKLGRTDDLSEIHRVGNPVKGEPATTCGEKIPEPARRLPLGPGLMATIRHCKFCTMMLERSVAA